MIQDLLNLTHGGGKRRRRPTPDRYAEIAAAAGVPMETVIRVALAAYVLQNPMGPQSLDQARARVTTAYPFKAREVAEAMGTD